MAWVNTQQSEAFKDLLTLRGANGGKLRFKDMKELVDKYKQKGYNAVTRDNLYYRLHSYKTATTKDGDLVGASFSTSGRQSVLSDLSGETRSESEVTPPLNDITNTTNSNTVNTNSGNNNQVDLKIISFNLNVKMKEKWFQLPLSGYVQRVEFYAFLIHSSTLPEVVFCATSAYLSPC